MASVHDVAAYILQRQGRMTAMKLQKLVYYSKAWSLVWDEDPLFRASIEAWANGPVCPQLYRSHRGQFSVESLERGDPTNLTSSQRETVDAVLDFYGGRTAQWLSDLTHSEAPWRNARRGVVAGQHCENEISDAAMAEYYASL